jgi:DNA-binding CsgD family transcriptional regulator
MLIHPEIVGREAEIAAILTLFDGVVDGSRMLLLEGEAGIGKTTLWRRGIALAAERSHRVLSCSPSQAETQLSFAGLGDLLADVLDEALALLPNPQRRALAVALLLEDADESPPNQRAIALAFLGALRALAREDEVVVAVDDLQWLDGSSAFVLEFALRRLRDERVAALFGLRSGEGQAPLGLERALPDERLERLVVRPLSVGAVHRLVRDRLGLVLTRPALRRLHGLSGGNPFYALELGRAFQGGTISLERGEPLPPTLEALVGQRLSTLPEQTREALAAAATLSHPTVSLVGSLDVLQPAIGANVIVVDNSEVRFTHPLLAAAAYAAIDLAQRRELHRRVAQESTDVEERARHLAVATTTPDATVAAELDAAALAARRRGAPAAAAELAEQARVLTPSDDRSSAARRARAAAVHAFAAGDTHRAIATLDEAIDAAETPADRAAALHSLARIYLYEGDQPLAVDLLRRALAVDDATPVVRADAELTLATTLFYMRENLSDAAEHARRAVELAERVGEPYLRANARSTAAVIETLVGGNPSRADVDIAMGEWDTPLDRPLIISHLGFNAAILFLWTDQLDHASVHMQRSYERAVEQGDEAGLPIILAHFALTDSLMGRWDDAYRRAEKAYEAGLESGQRPQQAFALAVRALVNAYRGDVEPTREDAARALELTGREGMVARIAAESALGILDLSLENYAAVVDRLRPLAERLEVGGVREPGTMRFVPDAIEALIALGRFDEARAELRKLETRAAAVDRPSARAAAHRCAGLLCAAEDDVAAALECFERADEQHGRVPMPFERTRTSLARGSVLRRARRRRDARSALEEVATEFERLGAALWAQRARDELERIGGRISAGEQLTPTEERVAALVARGLPNREVAAALFVTPKTVEFHLRNVFRKLGIHSRAELARRAP